MKSITWFSWLTVLVALCMWLGVVYGTFMLNDERATLASAREQKNQDEVREEVQARLRATVRDTETERALVNSLVSYPIVKVVEAIEVAGKAAGVQSISQAYPQAMQAKELSAVLISLEAQGTFSSLVRAIALFESLPVPTVVEYVQLDTQKDGWALNARLKVVLATQTL